MTKKDMIEKIQKVEEYNYINHKHYEDVLGKDDEITKAALRGWATIYLLMEELGIETKREVA